MDFADTLILDAKARRLRTGELVASVRCARTGLQDYAGHEVGKPDLERVTVYRPESEVMKRDSLATFAGVPVTIDHPKESVTTDNWKKYAVGEAGDEVVRDGEFIRVPILVRDESAIQAIQDGKRQISMGYSCQLDFVDGVTPTGEPYQAIQRDIKINHLAVVDQARGGSALTVEDERTYADADDNDNKPHQRRETVDKGIGQMATKTILVDGLQVEVTDQAEAAIVKLQGQLADSAKAKGELEAQVAKLTTDNATLTADKAKLEGQLKDAELTPAKLNDAAKALAKTRETAKKVAPKAELTDEMDEPDIRRAAVSAHLGDAAKDWSDEQVAVSFDTLALKAADAKVVDPITKAITDGVKTNDGKTNLADARQEWLDRKENAYRGTPATAA